MRMIKFTVSLDAKIKDLLSKLAAHEGRTESELIREAIAKLLRERGFLERRTESERDPKEYS
ncbi:ribbon-helix-helix protein, CopG family [Thermococcus sp.]|uniref:ribbon-helix-helix protein, CopG family n=1 Tax=Thermococcus sp. TaxID=35749 RepID=UPI0026047BE1|nr:ribbon-helix-helix protein, CopG family [Thermococcus sp.]